MAEKFPRRDGLDVCITKDDPDMSPDINKEEELQKYIIEYDEINKRSIGKTIIKFCGNEGTKNDRNTEILRRLLQALISHVEEEHSDTWKNAEIRMYDENDVSYSIKAGQGQKMFLVCLDENDEPKVIKTKPSRVSSEKENKHCRIL